MDGGARAWKVVGAAAVAGTIAVGGGAGCASLLGIDKDYVTDEGASVSPDSGEADDAKAQPDGFVPDGPNGPARPVSISAGGGATCALVTGGGVMCWGDNASGELGDGTTDTRLRPVTVKPLGAPAVAVAVGGDVAFGSHTCALLAGGGARCWGSPYAGQLGADVDGGASPDPVPVGGLDALESAERAAAEDAGTDAGVGTPLVAAGGNFTCASRGGAVYCWGSNESGQLADGTMDSRTQPAAVIGVNGVKALVAGLRHACAWTSDNNVFCWGSNAYGQLGSYGFPPVASPKPLRVYTSNGDVTALAAGDNHTCMARNNRVQCWGQNASGQLGSGDTGNRGTPHDVELLSSNKPGAIGVPVAAFAAGGSHTCAYLTSGAVMCWGDNASGQLGDGTTTNQLIPVYVKSVPPNTGARAISLGNQHSCALFDGSVKCWGAGARLGDGTSNPSTDAVAVTF